MTRVLSALVLLPVVIGTIWFLPPIGTTLLACLAGALAFWEYRSIARALGLSIPGVFAVAVVLATLTVAIAGESTYPWGHGLYEFVPSVVDVVLLAALIVAGAMTVASGHPGPAVLANAAAAVFAPIYIGLPLGALAAVRSHTGYLPVHVDGNWRDGRLVVLLLMGVIVVSDSAQYYTGRAFGRRPLAPTISPKKTIEGAIGGVVFGTLAMAIGGYWLFDSPVWLLALLGAAIVMLGIVGDLFESLLKRSAGVKDSSNLIPGHGGVLDRIDSWLFAAPVYYLFVRFFA